MPRRRVVEKRDILPDPQYHDLLVARCINSLMFDGKKSVAEATLKKHTASKFSATKTQQAITR